LSLTSPQEFICALSVTSRGRLDEKLKCKLVLWPPQRDPLTRAGAFQLYDINNDGFITYDEMLQIVRSIYKMTGQMVRLPEDEDTPEKVCTAADRLQCARADDCLFLPGFLAHFARRCCLPLAVASLPYPDVPVQRVDKIFRNMDLNKDAKLTYDEFKEGSKQDPTIVQVSRGGGKNRATLPFTSDD
jgi:hypothetical protein